MCGCYDCLREQGITIKREDILGQIHDESDGKLVVRTYVRKDEGKVVERRDVSVPDPTVPSVHRRTLGFVPRTGRRRRG